MLNIRLSLFETNSSSTHSLVVMTKEQFQKWAHWDEHGHHSFLAFGSTNTCTPDKIKFKIYDQVKEDYWTEDVEDETDFFSKARYYGYLNFDQLYYSLHLEFDNYVILSIYESE